MKTVQCYGIFVFDASVGDSITHMQRTYFAMPGMTLQTSFWFANYTFNKKNEKLQIRNKGYIPNIQQMLSV